MRLGLAETPPADVDYKRDRMHSDILLVPVLIDALWPTMMCDIRMGKRHATYCPISVRRIF